MEKSSPHGTGDSSAAHRMETARPRLLPRQDSARSCSSHISSSSQSSLGHIRTREVPSRCLLVPKGFDVGQDDDAWEDTALRGTRQQQGSAAALPLFLPADSPTLSRLARGVGVSGFFLLLLVLVGGSIVPAHDSCWMPHADGFCPGDVFLTADDYALATATLGQQEQGNACYTAADCQAGSLCAFPAWHNRSLRICCADAVPVGLGVFDNDLDNDLDKEDPDAVWWTVCRGAAAAGEQCGSHDALCASGVCWHGTCAAGGPRPEDAPCARGAQCQSGACGHVRFPLATGDVSEVPMQCCASTAVVLPHPSVAYRPSFCVASVVRGAPCGTHDVLCASGACHVNGLCYEDPPP
jgi:hypothetical protein